MNQHKEDQLRYLTVELIDKANPDVIEVLFSADYVAHTGARKHRGHPFLKRFAKQLYSVMPDIKTVKIAVLAVAGDTITWERTFTGTHKAKMRGIPASGKKLTWREMVVSRFEDGKIAEEWVVSELMGEMLLNRL